VLCYKFYLFIIIITILIILNTNYIIELETRTGRVKIELRSLVILFKFEILKFINFNCLFHSNA
jgi:hypothetical protein